jgi:hypothetical protein
VCVVCVCGVFVGCVCVFVVCVVWCVCGVPCVMCGLWCVAGGGVVYGVSCAVHGGVVSGAWSVACGVWRVVCGVWCMVCVVCVVWSVVCCVLCVVCHVWCVVWCVVCGTCACALADMRMCEKERRCVCAHVFVRVCVQVCKRASACWQGDGKCASASEQTINDHLITWTELVGPSGRAPDLHLRLLLQESKKGVQRGGRRRKLVLPIGCVTLPTGQVGVGLDGVIKPQSACVWLRYFSCS